MSGTAVSEPSAFLVTWTVPRISRASSWGEGFAPTRHEASFSPMPPTRLPGVSVGMSKSIRSELLGSLIAATAPGIRDGMSIVSVAPVATAGGFAFRLASSSRRMKSVVSAVVCELVNSLPKRALKSRTVESPPVEKPDPR
jgi:hypothetical protein